MRLGPIDLARETCSFDPKLATLARLAAFGLHAGRAIAARSGILAGAAWPVQPWRRLPRPILLLDPVEDRRSVAR